MKLRTISENSNRSDHDIAGFELAFVGPKSPKSSRKLGAYLLPHNLATINWELIDNLEYFERCVVYDLTHDQIAIPEIQLLKNEFVKQRVDSAELIIEYKIDFIDEIQNPHWKGSVVPGVKHSVSSRQSNYYNSYLLINGKKLRIPSEYGYAIFLKHLDN